MELLQYTFSNMPSFGSLLASIACGLIGTYIVTRRLVFISGGLTHASFGGIGLGLYTGISPHSVGSLVCSLVRFRCRVAQQTEGHAGRLRHCRILDIGHGTGHHVHFPLAGIRTRLVRLSLRQHSHDYLERHRSIGRLALLLILFFALYLHPIIYVASTGSLPARKVFRCRYSNMY